METQEERETREDKLVDVKRLKARFKAEEERRKRIRGKEESRGERAGKTKVS